MRNPALLLWLISSAANAQLSCADALPIDLGTHSVPSPMFGDPLTDNCISNGNLTTHASWYLFTATVDTAILVSSNVAGNPVVYTRVHVLTGDCAELSCLAGDDYTGPNFTSETWFRVRANESYYIVWDDQNTQWAFSFSVAAYDPPDGAVNFSVVYDPLASGVLGLVDMNNDGLDDMVMPGQESIQIAHQQPDGGLVLSTYPITEPDNPSSWSFSVGDWDSNGQRDMIYGGSNGATFMKAYADGSGYTEISFPQSIFCQRTNFADINHDGHLDAFTCHDLEANVAFINDGAGNLTFDQGGYGETCGNYGSLFTDIDDDGDADLFIAKCGCDAADLLMLNDGAGNFSDIAPQLGLNDGHQSWSAAWGDLDNDGDLDALIGSSDGEGHKLLRNDGSGSFTDVSEGSGMEDYPGSSNEWVTHDFNNDGWLDILGGRALHYNRGDMTFSHDPYAPANGPIGDVNNDGYLDIGMSVGSIINQGTGANWIRVVPVGMESNRDGIGARVTIVSALGEQTREIRSGDGFRYMSFIGAHFGLSADESVDLIRIRWPSGIVDTIHDPSINTSHLIPEGISTGMTATNGAHIQLSPNPANDVIEITGVARNASVTLADMAGRTIRQAQLKDQRLHVADLRAGAYHVIVHDELGTHRMRLVKR